MTKHMPLYLASTFSIVCLWSHDIGNDYSLNWNKTLTQTKHTFHFLTLLQHYSACTWHDTSSPKPIRPSPSNSPGMAAHHARLPQGRDEVTCVETPYIPLGWTAAPLHLLNSVKIIHPINLPTLPYMQPNVDTSHKVCQRVFKRYYALRGTTFWGLVANFRG